MKKVGHVRRFFREIGLMQHQPDKLRLEADVASLQAWIDRRGIVAPYTGLPWAEVCARCLSLANDASKCDDVASGYEYLHIAERETAFGMTDTERGVKARSLCAEATAAGKFEMSWRARAILDLLCTEKGDPTASVEKGATQDHYSGRCRSRDDLPPEALAEAIAHRNTLDRNGRRRADKLRWQLAWMGAIVLALVVTAFVYVILHPISPSNLVNENLLAYAIYLGLLGGMMSSAITLRTAPLGFRVPEVELNFYAAVARGALGAATSIPVYIIAMSGLATIGSSDLSKTWGVLLLCFAAGFSERWFLGTVSKVTSDNKGPPMRGEGG